MRLLIYKCIRILVQAISTSVPEEFRKEIPKFTVVLLQVFIYIYFFE